MSPARIALRPSIATAALLFALSLVADAQGTWSLRAPNSTKNRAEAVAAHGGTIYTFGGATPCNSTSIATTEAYDLATNTWATRAPLPIATQQATAGTINGKVYVVGGGSCCGAYGFTQEYNPTSNSWSQKAPMPTPRYSPVSGVVNGILYVMSGGSGYGATYPAVEAYDPVTDSWTQRAPMTSWRGGAAVAVSGGLLYLIGGQNLSGTNLATLEVFDPAANSWTVRTPMPAPRVSAVACAYGGLIYVVGGQGPNGSLATVEAYNPASDTWTTLPSTPVTLEGPKGAVAVNGSLCVVGNQPGIDSYCPGSFMNVLAFTPSSTTIYCTAKLNSLACLPSIGASGTPSASAGSGFTLSTINVINNKPGLYLYSNSGRAAQLFQGGILCMSGPIRRTIGIQSGGNPPPNDCSGTYTLDMNAFAVGALGGTPATYLTVAGTVINVEAWGRDPGFPAPNNSTLSNALEYTIEP